MRAGPFHLQVTQHAQQGAVDALLVHLVRFASGLAAFEETRVGHRDDEERKVSRIAAEALAPSLGPAARPALDALSGGAAPPAQRSRRGTGANPV